VPQRLFEKFPKQINRENISRNREFSSGNREFHRRTVPSFPRRHYIQPINYPTVLRGVKQLRITPIPYDDDVLMDALAEALVDVWARLGLAPQPWQAAAE
jgi:hypothetical protein